VERRGDGVLLRGFLRRRLEAVMVTYFYIVGMTEPGPYNVWAWERRWLDEGFWTGP